MFHVVRRGQTPQGAIATVALEGEPYGAGVSLFLGDLLPGKGPALHRHPYPEICLVRAGQVAVTVDGQDIIASAGDIVIIGPELRLIDSPPWAGSGSKGCAYMQRAVSSSSGSAAQQDECVASCDERGRQRPRSR